MPFSALVPDGKGNLYFTTFEANNFTTSCCGLIYKISTNGVFSVVYTFTGGADGAGPLGVVFDKNGNLYGIAEGGLQSGGRCGCGVVYKLDTTGHFTTLYTFTGGTDGANPVGSLVLDSAGNLYGATLRGGNLSDCGPIGCGVIFKVDPSGNETVLHTFTGGADGARPNGFLLLDPKGNLYGTATSGGYPKCNNPGGFEAPGCGVVFKLTPSGTEKVLATFSGRNGANPVAGLLADSAFNLFGTTEFGGASNDGTVFELNKNGVTLLHTFSLYVDGQAPEAGVIRDAQGNLYGTTWGSIMFGCELNCGSVFKLVAPPEITKFSPTSGAIGSTVSISGVSLSQSTAVTFNGVAAAFTVNADRLVTATVPAGATTGAIAITSPGGTATSSTNFTVTP
jgi:uncharacterized repeat protein (TIGR03803 family)